MTRTLVLLALLSFFVPATGSQSPDIVSMIQLVGNPEKYNNKYVSVIGFLKAGTELDTLYLSQNDYIHVIIENGVWMQRNTKVCDERERLDMNYVLVEGTFSSQHKGYSPSVGGITNVTKCQLWSELWHPKSEQYWDVIPKSPK